MEKTDIKNGIPGYRAPRGRFEVVTMPPLRYLMIDGRGGPNTSDAYRESLEALYLVAYRLKFFSKRELGRDYGVMPLEALWWAEDMAAFTSGRDKSRWQWTVLNLVPEWLTGDHVEAARDAVAAERSGCHRLASAGTAGRGAVRADVARRPLRRRGSRARRTP